MLWITWEAGERSYSGHVEKANTPYRRRAGVPPPVMGTLAMRFTYLDLSLCLG